MTEFPELRVTKARLIKAGYKPGFEIEDALIKFQPDALWTDAALESWVKDNRPVSQTKRRNQ